MPYPAEGCPAIHVPAVVGNANTLAIDVNGIDEMEVRRARHPNKDDVADLERRRGQ